VSGPGRLVRVRVGTLRVVGASAIEARRVAEALPAALERALASWPDPPDARLESPGRAAARVVAAELAARVMRDLTTAASEVAW
jgi:hypothetical protein